jgi:small subunit ribosomal protein S17
MLLQHQSKTTMPDALTHHSRIGGRLITGKVVSTSMKDTVVVAVNSYRKHPKYGKYLRRTKKLKAHDAGNTCMLGDVVEIRETHPISKEKHFVVVHKKSTQVFSEEALSPKP